jgi:DNA-binding GntR family transcriptional regulator
MPRYCFGIQQNHNSKVGAAVKASEVVSVQIANSLRSKILNGDLMPGDRILQEEIAEEYQASRMPVREALLILVTDGLVEIVANSGAWVTSLTMAHCIEQYEIRERIEPLLLRASLPGLDDETLKKMQALVTELEANQDVKTFMKLDREFHMLSYSAAPDTTLKDIVVRLWNTTQAYRRVYAGLAGSPGLTVTHLEHRLLIEAIARKDSEEAERILGSHIRRTRIALAKHPEVFRKINQGD